MSNTIQIKKNDESNIVDNLDYLIKKSYRKVYIYFDHIERSNKSKISTNKTKYLSHNAKSLLAVIIQKLQKEQSAFLNHKYISTITNCKRRQNQNIIKELNKILNIQYHSSILYKEKKYRYYYEFSKKVNNFDKINNEKSSYIQKNISNKTVQNCSNITKLSSKIIGQNITRQKSTIYIDKKNNIINNRSNKSNFKKNFSNVLEVKNAKSKLQHSNLFKRCNNGFLGATKQLKDIMHYLTDEICNILRKLSGRNFTNRAIQQITQSIANKKTSKNIVFFHIKGFISYLTKVLIYEKRNACATNSENFYILSNKSQENTDIKLKEQYLTNIENTQQIDSLSRLQRKIAAVFERNKAYKILTSFDSIKIKEHIAQINFNSKFILTDNEKKTLLSQIKATYESINQDGLYQPISNLDICFNEKKQNHCFKNDHQNISTIPLQRIGVWGKIRDSFAKLLYDGDNIDKSWLSKFDVKTDHNNKTIKLFAPNSFFHDYVKSNYLSYIEKAAELHGVKIEYVKMQL